MPDPLQHACRQLRLSGLAASLELRLHEAASHGIPHRQFLELLFQDELNVRSHRSLERRKKLAQFPELQPLENFDWQFNPQINRAQIFQLATAQFVRERRDVLLLGPPGLGKSHIAQAIGYAALRADFQVLYCSVFELVRELQADPTPADARRTLARYLKPDLLCLDDFGMKSFPPKGAEALLEIIVRRHRNRSTLMTSNRPIEEWGALLGDVPAATAILDRLLEGAEIVRMQGRSYRLRNAAMMAGARKKADRLETPTETEAGDLGRSTGGPPNGAPVARRGTLSNDRCASSRDGSTPIGDPASSPKITDW